MFAALVPESISFHVLDSVISARKKREPAGYQTPWAAENEVKTREAITRVHPMQEPQSTKKLQTGDHSHFNWL